MGQAHEHWTHSHWEKVLWSDETKINRLRGGGRAWYWRQADEPWTVRGVQPTLRHGGGSIMIWGCMSANGVGHMCRINGGLDAELYVDILADEMVKSADLLFANHEFIFQHDNDSKHTAMKTSQWIVEQEEVVMDWPPQSPDLNPIEHLWAELKQRLRAAPTATSIDGLWERVQREWWAVDSEEWLTLVSTMPKRISDVIKA